MDPSTPHHIRKLDVLVTYRLSFSFFLVCSSPLCWRYNIHRQINCLKHGCNYVSMWAWVILLLIWEGCMFRPALSGHLQVCWDVVESIAVCNAFNHVYLKLELGWPSIILLLVSSGEISLLNEWIKFKKLVITVKIHFYTFGIWLWSCWTGGWSAQFWKWGWNCCKVVGYVT